jgi:hypothetical protein
MKRRTLLQNLVSSMVAAPVLSAYWKKQQTLPAPRLRVIGMRCFSFDADIPLTLYSFCGMGG